MFFFFIFRLYGTYEALHNGFTTKALQDLTGGIVQSFSLNSQVSIKFYICINMNNMDFSSRSFNGFLLFHLLGPPPDLPSAQFCCSSINSTHCKHQYCKIIYYHFEKFIFHYWVLIAPLNSVHFVNKCRW